MSGWTEPVAYPQVWRGPKGQRKCPFCGRFMDQHGNCAQVWRGPKGQRKCPFCGRFMDRNGNCSQWVPRFRGVVLYGWEHQ